MTERKVTTRPKKVTIENTSVFLIGNPDGTQLFPGKTISGFAKDYKVAIEKRYVRVS